MPTIPQFDGPRLIRREDLSASRRLSRICFSDLPDPAQEEEDAPLEADFEPQQTYLFAHQERPVSQISIFHTPLRMLDGLIHVGFIGGVCTHPDYRGYRLASRLMEHCTRRLVQDGAGLMMISGGRGLYTRLGNVPTGKYAGFNLRSELLPPPPASIRLRKVQPSDAALCSRMYQAEPAHFTRALAAFQHAFQPHALGFHAEEWLVELEGQPVAYLLLSIPWDYLSKPDAGVRRICEYAGSRVALAGAFAAALAQPGIREIQAPIPWQDVDLIHLLRQAAGRPQWIPLEEHTLRIINFPALMAGLRPYLRASLSPALLRGLRFEQSGPLLAGDGEGTCCISSGNGRNRGRGRSVLELSTAAMTNLVMGDPEHSLGEGPALTGALAEIIPALFPLPSFLPGLDYH